MFIFSAKNLGQTYRRMRYVREYATYQRLQGEEILKKQGILNVNACIGYPQIEDEYLTQDSVRFHEKLGYSMVGTFHKCGYKFGRWYDMVWMEKFIGEHDTSGNQPEVIAFAQLK